MNQTDIHKFQDLVLSYYKNNARMLPWRDTKNPYFILISEVMSQQTQISRVVPKYLQWIKSFPTIAALSQASMKDVLSHWSGLGYNRRARMLHNCAQLIESQYKGLLPKTINELKLLPGIGPYTASAICAFAYSQPVIVLDTNIRTIYIHHFFKNKTKVEDKDIIPLIEATISYKDPAVWYNALMDYGSMLKKTHRDLNKKSTQYQKQSKFEGSDRQIRGNIIKHLTMSSSVKLEDLATHLKKQPHEIESITNKLIKERLIKLNNNRYSI